MRIAIDLDGTICLIKRPDQTYAEVEPIAGAAERMRALRAAGHYLIILTARNMATCDSNVGKVMKNVGLTTLEWLARHGIEYDEIFFGKPNAEVYLDDRGVRFNDWAEITEEMLQREARPAMIVVMPMAGRGSRFADYEADLPKPLIPVAGRPMFAWALDGIRDIERSRIVFVGLEEHERRYNLSAILREHAGPAAELVLLPEVTQGQLCTVLAAGDVLDSEESVLVAPSDTYVVSALGRDIAACRPDCRGMLCVADLPGDRWSFARCDGTGRVVEVAEKKRISPHASTGHYFFGSGRELARIGREIVARNERTQGEFYVILVYRKMIECGMRVDLSHAGQMWDLGTPEALERFIRFLNSR